MAMPTRTLIPQDLFQVQMVDDPQLSPDGKQVAWVQSWIEPATNDYRSVICLHAVDGDEIQRVTNALGLCTHPRWSPDGQRLAYLTTRPPGSHAPTPPQLCIVTPGQDDVRCVTDLRHGIAEPAWSPDGAYIAFTTLVDPAVGLAPAGSDQPTNDQPTDDLYQRFNADVLVARRRRWKSDGFGYLGDLRRAVAVADLEVEDPASAQRQASVRLVAGGEFDLATPVWSPDGTQLAVVGNLDADADSTRSQRIYLLDPTPETPAPPRTLAGLEDIRQTQVAWSPDGTQVVVAGHDDPTLGHYGNQQLWIVDVASGVKRCITAQLDWTFAHAAYTDVGRYGGEEGVRWQPDGRHVLALVSRDGEVQVARVDVATGAATIVAAGGHDDGSTIAAFTIDAGGTTLAALVREPLNPADIYLYDLTEIEADARRMTAVNADWLDDVALAEPQKFQVEADGVTVDAWVLPPAGLTPGQQHPAILYTGGGPAGMRAANFLFEYQLLAAQGYALVFCNARGCQGYGEEFCTAILGTWGGHDYDDNMRCLDEACVRFDFIDPNRLGMAGGSYGGYLVNWALGHTDRFQAAVSDRSVFNRHSSFGTSDIGHLREFEFGNAPPWEQPERYLAQSPLSYIGSATTPTLVVHSAQDLRCAVEQGEQLYLALKQLGVPTELVRFPNESHGLSRGGRPWHRIFRLQAYLDWFETWL